MKKTAISLMALGLCIALTGCGSSKEESSSTGKQDSSLSFKTNGEIKDILKENGWKGVCSTTEFFLKSDTVQIAAGDDYTKVKEATSPP